jgi:hypothetical protein
VTGIVTSVTMIGPLLVDISRDLGISLGQAGLLAAAASKPAWPSEIPKSREMSTSSGPIIVTDVTIPVTPAVIKTMGSGLAFIRSAPFGCLPFDGNKKASPEHGRGCGRAPREARA